MFFNLLTESLNPTALYLGATAILIVIFLIVFLDRKSNFKFDTKSIAFAGIAIALSFVLSLIKIFALPQGGSVTLASLLPLLIFSHIYGVKKGAIAGSILGLLNFAIDPWFVHPGQFLLDYILAFSSIGVSGMFVNHKLFEKHKRLAFLFGAIISTFLRYASHTISGIFAFSVYATTDVLFYSLGYNAFVWIDSLIATIIGFIIISSKPIEKYIERSK